MDQASGVRKEGNLSFRLFQRDPIITNESYWSYTCDPVFQSLLLYYSLLFSLEISIHLFGAVHVPCDFNLSGVRLLPLPVNESLLVSPPLPSLAVLHPLTPYFPGKSLTVPWTPVAFPQMPRLHPGTALPCSSLQDEHSPSSWAGMREAILRLGSSTRKMPRLCRIEQMLRMQYDF